MKDKKVTIILISVSGNVMKIFSFKSRMNISRKQKFKDRLCLCDPFTSKMETLAQVIPLSNNLPTDYRMSDIVTNE